MVLQSMQVGYSIDKLDLDDQTEGSKHDNTESYEEAVLSLYDEIKVGEIDTIQINKDIEDTIVHLNFVLNVYTKCRL